MTHLFLFDGTTRPTSGRAVTWALARFAPFGRVTVSPQSASFDLENYQLVREAEIATYDAQRGQSNSRKMIERILHANPRAVGKHSLTIAQNDLYREGLNWHFGYTTSDAKGGTHVILSTARVQSPDELTFLVTHELGHAFGAAKPGRVGTMDYLGSHCLNDCVMQAAHEAADLRRRAQRNPRFCGECADELRSSLGNRPYAPMR